MLKQASMRSSRRLRLYTFIDPLGRPRFDLGGWLSLLKRWRPGAFLCDLFGAEPRVNLDGLPTPYAFASSWRDRRGLDFCGARPLGIRRLGIRRLGIRRLGIRRLGIRRLGIRRLGRNR